MSKFKGALKRISAWAALAAIVFVFPVLLAYGMHLFSGRVEHALAVSVKLCNPPPKNIPAERKPRMTRNPILDPRPGDQLELVGGKIIVISDVNERGVFWHTYDANGNMICLFDAPHDEWKKGNEHLRIVHLRGNEFKAVRDE